MQSIYSGYVVHLQSDHIHEDIKLQWNYLIMLLQQFSALVKLVEYENREKHSSFSAKYHICVPHSKVQHINYTGPYSVTVSHSELYWMNHWVTVLFWGDICRHTRPPICSSPAAFFFHSISCTNNSKDSWVPSTQCLSTLKKLLAVLMKMKMMCPFNIFIWDLEMKFVLFKGTQRWLLPVLAYKMQENYRGNIRQSFTSCRHATLYIPVLPNANTYRETLQEIPFIYLENTGIYHIFKTCYIIYVLFSMPCCLFHTLIFFCSYNMFFHQPCAKI